MFVRGMERGRTGILISRKELRAVERTMTFVKFTKDADFPQSGR